MSWYRKDNPDVIPGNPERIGKWDPIQYLDVTKYLKPFNEYPKDFNPRVHGAYLPYMYYGKAETPFSQLKIKEIPGWFSRRNKTPMDAYQLGLRSKPFQLRNMKVLIVGSGITGAIVSYLLRQHYAKRIQLIVYDKGRDIGGRMSTSRSLFDSNCFCDTGAQYLTMSNHSPAKKYFQQLIDAKIIKVLDATNVIGMHQREDKQDYVVSDGISTIVRYYFDQAEMDNIFNSKTINEINVNENNIQIHGELVDDECDALFLTIPVTQILQLKGKIAKIIENDSQLKINLEKVQYSSRFSVSLFYDESIQTLNIPWHIKYIDNDDCLRYVSVDNLKRKKYSPPFSLIAQTSVQFGAKHAENDKEVIGKQVLKHLFDLFPELPKPTETKFHKWRYSQITQPYSGKPGYLILNEKPLLLLTGDGFAESNFEACVEAATKAVDRFCQMIDI
ncbi:unnamed protein product [Didymodactylos carnosus]|uniref:Amine oxidase domain-containing protein n=1 Tax=Didymodactylos carnosus TaxID=1234261 RepID=A0A8S2S3P2_9BILA|nr:unnamed protein product [Didymodactylos carnosus]CAF4195899.1 unnamed protein product [Didymodactylos carnosus]